MTMSPIWIVFLFTLLTNGVHCEKRGTQPDREEVICEGETLEITCSGKQEISITGAEYGRTEPGSKHCPFPLLDLNTKCYSADSTLEITKGECEGFKSCTLYANDDEYGDPCPRLLLLTHKYLKVSYKCIPAKSPVQKIRVCESKKASIDCPKRSKIRIKYANYGRTKAHVCGALITLDKNCRAENSMEIVEADCNGKDNCLLEATNGKFGDPCFLTPKYLEVGYECK